MRHSALGGELSFANAIGDPDSRVGVSGQKEARMAFELPPDSLETVPVSNHILGHGSRPAVNPTKERLRAKSQKILKFGAHG